MLALRLDGSVIGEISKKENIPENDVFKFSQGLIDLVQNEVDEKMSLLSEIFSGNREKDKNNLSFEWAINWSLGANTFLKFILQYSPNTSRRDT